MTVFKSSIFTLYRNFNNSKVLNVFFRNIHNGKVSSAALSGLTKDSIDFISQTITLSNTSMEAKNTVVKSKNIVKNNTKLSSFGVVTSIIDGVATILGITGGVISELVEFKVRSGSSVKGMIISLEKGYLKVVIFGNDLNVTEGTLVFASGSVVSIKVNSSLVGHVIDALGTVIDDTEVVPSTNNLKILSNLKERITPVDIKAPGVIARSKINEPIDTGLLFIDTMVPIGRGQRELIIGDKQTGKTSVAVDTIVNQKFFHLSTNSQDNFNGVFCVYVAIGQKRSSIVKIANKLSNINSMFYTIIVSATASDAASLQYIAPYTGCAVGEWFRDNGLHALIVYDDLSKHAVAYRQMSLLLRRPSSREAYPGDVFYLHSRLLERAAKLSVTFGLGSLTALPIIETQLGDVSASVATNVISITDGQIYLDSELFNKGIRPAVSAGISVSRVGAAAQSKAIRKFASKLKLELAQYREVELFSAFASELDEATQMVLKRGLRLLDILKQPRYSPLNRLQQLLLVFSGVNGYFDNLDKITALRFKLYIIEAAIRDVLWFENLDFNEEITGNDLNYYIDNLFIEFNSIL